MQIISMVAAIDEQDGLGYQNRLLCHLPADLKHFKQVTIGKPIIMGRRTFESIGRPLPNRHNIVLSRSDIHIPGVSICKTIDEVLQITQNDSEIMVIGGAEIFKLFLPMTKQLYITRIHHTFEADVFFPTLQGDDWILISSQYHPADQNNAYDFTIQLFRKNLC